MIATQKRCSTMSNFVTTTTNNNSSSAQKPPMVPPLFISISKKKLLKNLDINNGGQRINAWVDSMRASSPTHLKSLLSSISSQQQLNSWIILGFGGNRYVGSHICKEAPSEGVKRFVYISAVDYGVINYIFLSF